MKEGGVYHFADIEWHLPISKGTDPEDAQRAADLGAGRKFLAQGDSGFYAQVVKMPAGLNAAPHSHDHAEVFMVLSGSCEMMGQQMSVRDMAVVAANQSYGFTPGPDGVEFLVVRTAEASWKAAD